MGTRSTFRSMLSASRVRGGHQLSHLMHVLTVVCSPAQRNSRRQRHTVLSRIHEDHLRISCRPASGQAEQCQSSGAYLSGMEAGSWDTAGTLFSTEHGKLLARHVGWEGHRPPGGHRPEGSRREQVSSSTAQQSPHGSFQCGSGLSEDVTEGRERVMCAWEAPPGRV